MMENQPPITSPGIWLPPVSVFPTDGSRKKSPPERWPPHSHNSTQEEHSTLQGDGMIVVKVEDGEEEQRCAGEEISPQVTTEPRDTTGNAEKEERRVQVTHEGSPTEIRTDGCRNAPETWLPPLYSRDAKEDEETLQEVGEVVVCSKHVRPSLHLQDDNLIKVELNVEVAEMYGSDAHCEEKDIPAELRTDGQCRKYAANIFPIMQEGVKDGSDITCAASEDLVTPNPSSATRREAPVTCHMVCRGAETFSESAERDGHQGREKVVSCPECGKHFKRRENLITHQKTHSGERIFSCSHCGKYFNRRGNLMAHQRTHSGEKPFTCPECGKGFSWKVQLIRHQVTHPAKNPFSCSDCGESFSEIGTLTWHKKTHTLEKPYSCPECGKRFSWKVQLVRHLRIHTGEKPFPCSECGKCFPQISALNRHKKIHTGQKPYTCSECGMCFTERSYLAIHERTHSAEKPFSCPECGKSFNRSGNLIAHQRTHMGVKPFSCSSCGEHFSRKWSLMTHEMVHTGEKPYTCSDCGKCFTQRGSLVLHQRSHTGHCPYSCSKCGKGFPRRDY